MDNEESPHGADAGGPIGKPLIWQDAGGVRVELADQFAIQRAPGETAESFILVIGQVDVPLIIGNPEEQRRQVEAIPYVGIRIIGRYSLSVRHLEQLGELVQMQLSGLNTPEAE